MDQYAFGAKPKKSSTFGYNTHKYQLYRELWNKPDGAMLGRRQGPLDVWAVVSMQARAANGCAILNSKCLSADGLDILAF